MKIFDFKSISPPKGFTLIEVVTSMAITSVLLILFLTILSMTVKTSKEIGDDDLLSRQYAITLMEREMEYAEKIYDIRKWRNIHPGHLGFMLQGPSYQGEGHVYIYYYKSRNNLYRTAVNVTKTIENPKAYPFFLGASRLCDNTEIISEFSPESREFSIELQGKPPVKAYFYLDGLIWEDSE